MKHVATQKVLMYVVLISCFFIVGRPQAQAETSQQSTMLGKMLTAREKQIQITPLTHTFGNFSMEAAYYIQNSLAQEVAKIEGPVTGYKVAYASKAAQKQFNMKEPARGPFYMSQRLPNGSTLPSETFNEIMLETEVAFTIGKKIDKPLKNVAALKSYVKWVHPAFDAGNFPYTVNQAKPTPSDMIAIGTGAHVFVIGPAMNPRTLDLSQIDLALARNGETIRKSPARDVLGNPWNSLLWCVNHLHKYGLTLEPGMVVLTGTAAPAYKVKGEDIKGHYVGDCGPLGKVTLTIK
jgi:2-keto-4-pentenoate hydratase